MHNSVTFRTLYLDLHPYYADHVTSEQTVKTFDLVLIKEVLAGDIIWKSRGFIFRGQ